MIAAAIVVPIVAGFAIAGPGLGVGVAALVAFAIIWIAARQRPLGPLGAPAEDGRRHVLLVTTCPVEEPAAVRRIAAAATLEGREDADVLVLSPARIGFLDRWASDVEGARQVAQQNLVATVAALAKAGIAAEARVGDEDVVQAVEDQLQSFPANEVVLISGNEEEDEDSAAELESRLRAGFRHVLLGGG